MATPPSDIYDRIPNTHSAVHLRSPAKIPETNGLVVGQLDTTALQTRGDNPVFGADLFTVARGESKKSENQIILENENSKK